MTQSFGQYLRQARESKNLTQGQVASKLGYTSAQFISNFERGICAPAEDKMKDLMKLLGLSKKETRFYWVMYQAEQVGKRADRIFGVSK